MPLESLTTREQLCITDFAYKVFPETRMDDRFGKQQSNRQPEEQKYNSSSDPSKDDHQQHRQQQQPSSSSSSLQDPYNALQNLVDRTVVEQAVAGSSPPDNNNNNMMMMGDVEQLQAQQGGGSHSSYLSELLPMGVSEPFPPEQQLEPSISDFSALGVFGGGANSNVDHVNAAPVPWHQQHAVQGPSASQQQYGMDANANANQQYRSHSSSVPFSQQGSAYPHGMTMLPPQQQQPNGPSWGQSGEAPMMQSSMDASGAAAQGGGGGSNRGMVPVGVSNSNDYTMPSSAAAAGAPLPPPASSMLAPNAVQEAHRPIGGSLQQQEQELRMAQRELHIMQQQAIISQQIQQLQQLQGQMAPGTDPREAFHPPAGPGGHGHMGQHHYQQQGPPAGSSSFSMPGPYSPSMLAAARSAAASAPTSMVGSSYEMNQQLKPRASLGGSSSSRSTVSSSSSTTGAAGGASSKPAPNKGPWKVDPASAFLKKRKNDKNRPKRPLSAYNLFFKDERAKMVAATRAERSASAGSAASAGTTGESSDSASTAAASMPATATKKVKQRSGVAFVTMAQTIAARWKAVDSQTLAEYKAVAAKDMERYRKEMDVYKQKKAQQKKDEAKSGP